MDIRHKKILIHSTRKAFLEKALSINLTRSPTANV